MPDVAAGIDHLLQQPRIAELVTAYFARGRCFGSATRTAALRFMWLAYFGVFRLAPRSAWKAAYERRLVVRRYLG